MLIIGFATVLAMAIAVVIDASAAYLQRQGLDNLADGAALHGADLGRVRRGRLRAAVSATAPRAHRGRRPGQRCTTTSASAGAHDRYPGLAAYVDADPATRRVRVRLTAPLHLPLKVPGGQESALISATGAAVVAVDQ